MTYKNIKLTKIIRKRYSTEKRENKALTFIVIVGYVAFFSLAEKIYDFIVSKNEVLIASIYNSIINSSFLTFIGSFYLSFILITVSIILAIYFNYYYRLEKKIAELATISNWREL